MKLVARHKSSLIWVLFCLTLVFVFSGQVVTNVSAIPREDYENLETFTSSLSIVKKNYVEHANSKQLINRASHGILNALDPPSAFLPRDIYKDLQMDTQGRFGGLGIEITIKNGVLTVVSPIEDTPAYKAGVKAGDQIIKIEEI